MRLRHQALTLVLAAASLCGGGCARILGHILAPQEAAMSAAGNAANTVTAPARSELVAVNSEVERLLNGKIANVEELRRLKEELGRRLEEEPGRGPSAQDEPERRRPWHPRVQEESRERQVKQTGDVIQLGQSSAERGIAKRGPLPDGISDGDLPAPLDLSQVRVRPKR